MTQQNDELNQAPVASGADTAAPAEAEAGQPTIEQLLAQNQDLKDRMLRLAAETENFKRRNERDKTEFLKRANESLVKELLPVVDNLERALQAARDHSASEVLGQGVEMVYQELLKLLQKHGLEPVEAVGQAFDPETHEAIMQQEDPQVPDNTVLQQMQRGYLFQGRLLRPALVVVSKGGGPGDDVED